MRFRPTITTQTYSTKYHFLVDIVKKSNVFIYEAWIYHDQYGVKDLMFGIPTEQQTYEEFLEIVFNNIDEYIDSYVDNHFTYDERRKFYAENHILES